MDRSLPMTRLRDCLFSCLMRRLVLEGRYRAILYCLFGADVVEYNVLTLLLFNCTGTRHTEHRDVCSSVKFMMLHVRDCPGTTATYDICPFPWCRKVKHSLYHLVSCTQPEECSICSSQELSSNIKALVGLNEHRRQKQRERRTAAMAAAAAAAKAKSPPRAVAKSKAATGPKSAYQSVYCKGFRC